MRKRTISLLLSLLILLSLLPFGAVKVSAASNMTTSDDAIAILKKLEGFISKPMYDHGQYSVGYGSACGKNEYPNGITEAEADALLRKHLGNMEKNVNYFIDRYALSLKQHQFDALMLFTYNVGAGWTNADGEMRQAVISGATGNDFIYPFTLWANASSQLQMTLVKRRLAEANMYLNGVYSAAKPVNYSYVLFDNNGGVGNTSIQGYDVNQPTCIRPLPVRTGYRFVGWYTAEKGGRWVTHVNTSTTEKTLIARWQQGNGDPVNGIPASYSRTASNLSTLDVYEQPNGGKIVKSLTTDASVQIVADYVDASGNKWGKLEGGGWVNLGSPLFGVVTTHETHDPIKVTVTNSYVNVRSGPNTTYAQVGTLKQGTQVDIVETRLVGKDKWGRFKDGWISLMYTDYESVLADKDADNSTVIATGTVYNCDSLRIRAGAGTSYPVLGSLPAGTKVEITQQKQGSGMMWGRISSGWISLSYVKLDAAQTETPEQPGSSTPEQPETAPDAADITVTVTNSYINVRSGPNTTYSKVGMVYYGQQLKLTETRKMGNDMWGKFESGWVSLMYTNYASVISGGAQSKPEATPPADNAGTSVNLTVTVTNSYINVRSGPNTTYAKVGMVYAGQQLKLTETRKMGNDMWGKFESGWVSLMYTNYASVVSSGTTATPDTGNSGSVTGVNGTVNTQHPLNIRTGAGTHNVQIGTYTNGTRITILEHTSVNGQLWGRTNRGWVCLDYVKLDGSLPGTEPAPETQPSVPETEPTVPETQPSAPETQPGTGVELNGSSSNTGTVTSYSNLNIRSAPGTFNSQVGSYARGTRVTILEQKTINGTEVWGRTDKGWVSMMYVKMDPTEQNTFKGVVNTDDLNIRSGPGVHNKVLGQYDTGAQVEITEVSYIVDVPWGKTDQGWICLYYVNEI